MSCVNEYKRHDHTDSLLKALDHLGDVLALPELVLGAGHAVGLHEVAQPGGPRAHRSYRRLRANKQYIVFICLQKTNTSYYYYYYKYK